MLPAAITGLTGSAAALRRRLIEWCELNTGSGNVAGLAVLAGRLADACRELTADVTLEQVDAAGRVAVRARVRPAAAIQVLIAGHYDTVYDPTHPFQRCRLLDGNRLNGP